MGLASQPVAFAVGESSKTVTVSITDNTVVESNETFGLIVQQNAADPASTFLAKATFTIVNDDTAATTWAISPATASVSEGAGSVTFTVSRSSSSTAQTVYASTTQTEGFTNNNDYVGLANQPMAFAVGQSSKTVTVSITDNTVVEPNETFGLIVQQNTADPVSTFLAKARFTIVNND